MCTAIVPFSTVRGCVFLVAACLCTGPAEGLLQAAEFDPQAAWPLCGRLSDSPPANWMPGDPCPPERFGDARFSDQPLSSTFGPRPLYSGANRYDFHRGLDIATPVGTPFFAVTGGLVQIAGADPSYSDPLVKLRHYRPGYQSCAPAGCYYSLYLHISQWVVAAGQTVAKGQLLGYTGASSSGFEHMHFEVRDAPSFDPNSAWSRDAIHSLRLLPYSAQTSVSMSLDATPPSSQDSTSTLSVTLLSSRYDLQAVDVEVLDRKLRPIPQAGDVPDSRGYPVHPPYFDMEWTNFLYSHKSSSAFPWSSFGAGGANECPYHAEHGGSYDASLHVDAQDPQDYLVGLFNGIRVRTLRYWPSNERDYEISLEFLELEGDAACMEVTATFASGGSAGAAWGDCLPETAVRPSLQLSANTNGRKVRLAWNGIPAGRVDIYRNGVPMPVTVSGKFWTDHDVSPGGRYRYRVCPVGQADRCSRSEVIRLKR